MENFELGAAELARQIATGELSAREAVDAFIARIEAVDGEINAVVVRRFEAARHEADAADQIRAAGQPLGPLHGVPITVKECFHLAGTPSCVGLTHLASQPIETDGPLVARLKQAGAIVLGKTNVPQMMLFHETDNPVYGRTNNPWNLERVCGGSTGGEAAIIAAGGSPLGLGSDLGGSIRVPSHFCGVCGIKPTSGRLTRAGTFRNLRGMEAFIFQPGPLARRVNDLVLALAVLSARSPDSPRPDDGVAGLRIAMWTDDGFFPASPAVRRAVEEAARVLADRGAIIEPFQPPDIDEAMSLYLSIISADGGADVRRLAKGSRLDPRLIKLIRLGRIPRWLRPEIAVLLRFLGQDWQARLLLDTGPRSADGYWRLVDRLADYVRKFFAALDRQRIDAMLCPPHALPAFPHGASTDLIPAASYAFLPNLLGIPVGVVPVTRVRDDEQSARRSRPDRSVRSAIATDAASAGLPVGVQIAARPWREDVCLAVMAAVQDSVGVFPLAKAAAL